MSKPLVSDALWALVVPLLPVERPKPTGGRPRIPDRAALTGILFVLKSGIPWEMLPQELGCGSGMTCWRRLRDWQHAGVWTRLHHMLLQRLQDAGQIDWERASLDSASVPAPGGGEQTGKDPTNRGKLGTKRHVVVDRNGVPLAVTISGANVHDSQLLEEAVDAILALRLPHRQRGRPRKRPVKLHADKGYDYPRCRRALRARSIVPRIARRGIESSERLGRFRWVVERTLSWLNRFRRLKVRYERRADIHQAFLSLGCALICWKQVQAGDSVTSAVSLPDVP
ncbi:MAG TPA: IS5 family transposase [Ktedonobacterales bacterium]|nr:IS5 family transposase [Ktedonobacterales bacterium]